MANFETNREELEKSLRIDEDALDQDLTEQPGLFYHVATALAQANSKRDLLKLQLDEAIAKADHQEREAASRNDRKITEAAVQNLIRLDPVIQRLQREGLDAKTEAERWGALKEAYLQRSYMLKEIVAFQLSQMQNLSVERGAVSARHNLGDKARQQGERQRAEKRQGR